MNKLYKAAIIAAFATALSACGGGGSSEPTQYQQAQTAQQQKLASDAAAIQARINACNCTDPMKTRSDIVSDADLYTLKGYGYYLIGEGQQIGDQQKFQLGQSLINKSNEAIAYRAQQNSH